MSLFFDLVFSINGIYISIQFFIKVCLAKLVKNMFTVFFMVVLTFYERPTGSLAEIYRVTQKKVYAFG